MKKTLLIMSFVASIGLAETINLNANWNLISSSNAIDVTKITDSNVKIIWRWHNQQWEAYSNNDLTLNLIKEKNIPIFTSTLPNEGIWVYAINSTSITIDSDDNTSSYAPDIKTLYVGDLWGYEWKKILQTYDGDQRYIDGTVAIENNTIKLLAQKVDNQDRRAAVVAEFDTPKISLGVSVNMVDDNVYSKFQAIPISDNLLTSSVIEGLSSNNILYFMPGISIYKNSISAWYDFLDSNGVYLANNGVSQQYSFDLTQLNDSGDLNITYTFDPETQILEYKVVRLDNGDEIFNYELNISKFGFTNFTGFNEIVFRSRVDDAAANENNAEAIDDSLNYVTSFESVSSLNYDTVAVNEVNTTVAATDTSNDFSNETPIDFDADSIINKTVCGNYVIKDDGSVDIYDSEGNIQATGTWYLDNGALILNEGDDSYSIVEYENYYNALLGLSVSKNGQPIYSGYCRCLNTTTPYDVSINSSDDLADLIPDYWANRAEFNDDGLLFLQQEIISIPQIPDGIVAFDTSNKTFTVTLNGTTVLSGSYEIDPNGVLIYNMTYDDKEYKLYIVLSDIDMGDNHYYLTGVKFLVDAQNNKLIP